jgi:peptidoglycan glycosyltransferase
VFKLVTAAAGLRAAARGELAGGVVGAASTCPGRTLTSVLATSCNPPFRNLAVRLGPERMIAEAAALGIGPGRTLSGMPVADPTVVTDPGTARATGALELSGMGEGEVRVTLLHVTSLAAVVARGGSGIEPTVVAGVCVEGERRWSQPGRVTDAMSAAAAGRLEAGMRAAVEEGTAGVLAGTPYAWAAKTGTAALGGGRQAAWTVAYPTAGPGGRTVAVGVLVLPDERRVAPSGGDDAAPVVARLAAPTLPEVRNRTPC